MLPELKKNPDGSLTMYIQHESPGKEKESDWLPAPDGPIYMVLPLLAGTGHGRSFDSTPGQRAPGRRRMSRWPHNWLLMMVAKRRCANGGRVGLPG